MKEGLKERKKERRKNNQSVLTSTLFLVRDKNPKKPVTKSWKKNIRNMIFNGCFLNSLSLTKQLREGL